jgi:putative endonuclease
MRRQYYVYIPASRSRNVYTGVTNNLYCRMRQHREGLLPGFTSRYRIFGLVHFEVFTNIGLAIAREKEIKAWRREKRIRLIEQTNPLWNDFAAEWLPKPENPKRKPATPENPKAKPTADPSRPLANGATGDSG